MCIIYLFLGRTSLIWAAIYRKIDTVKILLEHEADVNTKDNNGLLHKDS